MTRDEAIPIGIFTLANWHRDHHGDRCLCLEGEQLGAQSAAVIDALAAEGMTFDGYSGIDRGIRWTVGPPARLDCSRARRSWRRRKRRAPRHSIPRNC